MTPSRLLPQAVLLLVPACFGQEQLQKHNFRLGLGVAQPRADLRNLYSDSFLLGFGYGYRFHPFFQADIGMDTIFGAAGVRDFLDTGLGPLRIRDFQYVVPFGGRAILPIARDRVQIFGGGGGAYLRYAERLRQPGDYIRVDCPPCAARNGWAYYATAGANVALDRGRHFRLGVTGKVYRGHTDGDALGSVPGFRTRDNWVDVMGEFTFSF